ncbi:hypothetical protein TRVA0_030S00430 [Trichomonascus vanleenenianus]|uniref:uncharacterized protein n=1 Tax=Trichomonascus vanleenenianus TaxID=2268995 RepID=UPI003ECAC92B
MSFLQSNLPKDKTFVTVECTESHLANLIKSHKYAIRSELIAVNYDGQLNGEVDFDSISTFQAKINLKQLLESVITIVKKDYLSLVLLSGSRSNADLDAIPVLGICDKELHLSLPKREYERTGIQGRKIDGRGLIVVQLDSENVQSKRDLQKLAERCGDMEFEVRVSVDGAHEDDITALTRLFGPRKSLHVETIVDEVYVPTQGNSTGIEEKAVENDTFFLNEIYEWLGLASLGSDRIRVKAEKVDAYVCAYEVSEPVEGKLQRLTFSGLVPRSFINRALVPVLERSASLIALNTIGHPDSPIAWKSTPHRLVAGSGSNNYTVLKVNGCYISYKHLTGGDL